MVLTPALEALIALEKDAAKQAEMRKDLEDGYRRQADYSRSMNELAAQKKQWNDWYVKADKEHKEGQAQVDALKASLAELQALKDNPPGGDLSGEEDAALSKSIRETRKEINDVRSRNLQLEETVSGINKMLSEGKLLTADKFEEELTKRGDGLGAAIFEIIDKQNQYRTMYGKELDRNVLISEAQKYGGDLNRAYEVLTAPEKETKLRKDLETEYEKKFNDRIRAANLPIDSGDAGTPTLGPLQSHIQKRDTGIPDDIPADGSGMLANKIAAELRAEGKF